MAIAQQYRRISEELARQCQKCGRDPSEVALIAVSKTVGKEGVASAFSAGARIFGENRPDQIKEKSQAFAQAQWHFIGNIQSRRIPDIVNSSDLIHSLCQESHAAKIDAAAGKAGFVQDVLVEVNVSGEVSKSGVSCDEAADLVSACASYEHIRVCGLMTMAPLGDASFARSCFEKLACLADTIRRQLDVGDRAAFRELSMGMSEDWREAVCAGATMVRVGRAIFQ